jgi:4-oxalocrotonate tautomerase
MPVITVETWEGRTVEQKRRLAAAITEAMVEHFQSNPERTYVLIYDIPKQNWARAGILSSDEEAAAEQRAK